MEKNELKFTVDSGLLGELGERLVRKNYIALGELIKNAYDADAKKIEIHFLNAKRKQKATSQILLIDDGHGMTFNEVKNYWMRIATPYKIREPFSPKYGRKKTGSKGIGRFACRRLAKLLTIETTAINPDSKKLEWTKVDFNWSDFKSGTDITEIPCVFETKIIKEGATGTTLRLNDLIEKWTDNEFNVLRRQILSLSITKGIKRRGFTQDPGFSIKFNAPEFPGGEGFLAEKFMDAGWGKIECDINKNGIALLNLSGKGIKKLSYQVPEKYSNLSQIRYEIAMIPVDKKYFRDTDLLTKGVAQDLLEEIGGIRVFIDGFRIYPYGEPGEDWLEIDSDKARSWGSVDEILKKLALDLDQDPSRAMLGHPRYRNVIGNVYISSVENNHFEIKMDREGLIENDAYNQLKRIIRISLQWATLNYNKYRFSAEKKGLKKAEDELKEKIHQIENEKEKLEELKKPLVEQALDVLSMETKRTIQNLPEKERYESEQRVKTASEFIQRSINRTETYSSILGAVASSGTYMMSFSHEIKALTSKLDSHANTIERLIKTIPSEHRNDFEKFATSLRDTRKRFDQLIKLFSILGKRTSEHEKRRIPIKKEINEILEGFEYLMKKYNIKKPNIDIPDNLYTSPMLDAEFFSIVVNLISNAIKAIIAQNGQNISIWGQKQDGKIVIRMFNDGYQLPKKYWTEVFEPLVADPEKKIYSGLKSKIKDDDITTLGMGSGLGLTIVKEMANRYNGDVRFIDVKNPWKTGIEVILP